MRSLILTDEQLDKIQSGPPYALLAAVGSTIQLKVSLALSPRIQDVNYPDTFQVSPKLRSKMILGLPWLKCHHVIHDHGADCIFIGSKNERKIYLD